MKIKFYLLPLLLFLFNESLAQPCSALTLNSTATESRCVATGSILVNATGGSGNYTYKAIGPITTPATSSNNITGLSPGFYSVIVKDLSTGCVKQMDNVEVKGSYDDPRFQLTKTDVTCLNNNGTISVVNQQFGRAPFTYTIIAPSPAGIGTSSTSGNFSGLPGGEYSIQLMDSCGGIQVRKITVESYSWWIDGVTVTPVGCDSASVSVVIRDNRNNTNLSGNAFTGFQYGYVLNGDTSWVAGPQFSVLIGNTRTLTIVVKDPCGQVHSYVWNFPNPLKPSLNNVQLSALACSTFTASVTGNNMTLPLYCLKDANGVVVSCNNTGSFPGLSYGAYCIEAFEFCYDTVITRCFNVVRPVRSVGANVAITNRTCATFTAAITGQTNLTNPDYCLLDNNGVLITCNNTGIFNNIPYGDYCIRVKDGCTDTLITRCFTVTRLLPVLTSHNITGANCNTFNVSVGGNNLINPYYCLYDENGTLISCDSSGVFTGLPHGSYCIRAISCGDTVSRCFSSSLPVPSIGNVSISRQCRTFRATVSNQVNLTSPTFCLYDNNNVLVRCNTTGVFDSIPYGTYCIRMQNTCYDTLITRCFTVAQLVPSLNTSMQVLNRNCSTVSFKVNGSNLTTPRYCLYDANNVELECNTTGTFNNKPYGYYCVRVTNNCYDTTMTVCQNFAPAKGISLATSKPCSIGNANIDVTFASGNGPFNVKVYHPGGALVKDTNATQNPLRLLLPALPGTTQYMVIGTDVCGVRDTAFVVPNANIVTTSTTVKAKCPGAAWLNGSGDIFAACTSNHYSVMPKIIMKNNQPFVQNHSTVSGGVYQFVDLEPAQYIVEYTQQTCNLKIYDTVTVPPYSYPTQGQSALYQCDNNGFSMGADVSGGVGPYHYQIIGSMPQSPSINTPIQTSPVFNISNGTVYSLVRLRTIDACGNATLSDVSVLPLQNIAVTASDSCYYQNILLTVDTVPNATYYWYKKTSPTDSVLLDSGLTYNMPFFQPEDIGQYVCKMVVNLGCVVRIARFDLFGCYTHVLPNGIQLKGKVAGSSHQLTWDNTAGVTKFIVERRTADDASFKPIGTVDPKQDVGTYLFNDGLPGPGTNQYRIRLVSPSGIKYSNTVHLGNKGNVEVYPNPVKESMQVVLNTNGTARYAIEIVNGKGQRIYSMEGRFTGNTTIQYQRTANIPAGMYILRITDLDANTTEIRKLLFE